MDKRIETSGKIFVQKSLIFLLRPSLLKHWTLDQIFTICRRQLYRDVSWRYGPLRVKEVTKEVFSALSPFTSFDNKVYCDLGCGVHHPHGTSAIMYINGVASAIAMDLADADSHRAAESLYDLLIECIIDPSEWRHSDITPEEYLKRLKLFDLKALRNGDLEKGIHETPLRHFVTSIHNTSLTEEIIDIMSSRAVLEHFLDFENAARRLYSLMKKGGIAYHHIDLVDHRAYRNPSKYHWWSFLEEDDNYKDGLVNRLRYSEVRHYFEKVGFKILRFDGRKEKLPDGFRKRVRGRFSRMSDEELSITGIFCVLKKPK